MSLTLTIVADPTTGMLYESSGAYRDGTAGYLAYRDRDMSRRPPLRFKHPFRPLQDATRELRTPDGCTVGENAAWLMPGEFVSWHEGLAILG